MCLCSIELHRIVNNQHVLYVSVLKMLEGFGVYGGCTSTLTIFCIPVCQHQRMTVSLDDQSIANENVYMSECA